jgi:hypothetical protein
MRAIKLNISRGRNFTGNRDLPLLLTFQTRKGKPRRPKLRQPEKIPVFPKQEFYNCSRYSSAYNLPWGFRWGVEL